MQSWNDQRDVEAIIDQANTVASPSTDWNRFKRPEVAEFSDESSDVFRKDAEFTRWYLQDGTARERPLDLDELIAELQALHGYKYDVAEWVACFDSRARFDDADLWSRYVEMTAAPSSVRAASLR